MAPTIEGSSKDCINQPYVQGQDTIFCCGQSGKTDTYKNFLLEVVKMKQYIGTKVVNMKPMTRQEYNDFRGWDLPPDENGADEGYLVEYPDSPISNTYGYDGYVSWSPKEQADAAYKQSGNMSFGDALHFLKKGSKLARSGWNGKGMWIVLAGPKSSHYVYNGNGLEGKCITKLVSTSPYLCIINPKGDLNTWVPSIQDCFAEDWVIINDF